MDKPNLWDIVSETPTLTEGISVAVEMSHKKELDSELIRYLSHTNTRYASIHSKYGLLLELYTKYVTSNSSDDVLRLELFDYLDYLIHLGNYSIIATYTDIVGILSDYCIKGRVYGKLSVQTLVELVTECSKRHILSTIIFVTKLLTNQVVKYEEVTRGIDDRYIRLSLQGAFGTVTVVNTRIGSRGCLYAAYTISRERLVEVIRQFIDLDVDCSRLLNQLFIGENDDMQLYVGAILYSLCNSGEGLKSLRLDFRTEDGIRRIQRYIDGV